MPFFYFDRYYIYLIVPAMLIAGYAQMKVSSTFNKYNQVRSARGWTGAQVARMILDASGLYSVRVEQVSGSLTDHYDPRGNIIRLSDSVHNSTSIAAIGVAAHECGHAVQHAEAYFPIKVRTAIIPISQIGSKLAIPMILFGFLLSFEPLVFIGIILFSTLAVFQLVTLPVEFNASARALRVLENDNILYEDENKKAKKVLSAAALTYVAALIVSVAHLLRYIAIFSRRRD